jgi:GGDEF domain-containing protein
MSTAIVERLAAQVEALKQANRLLQQENQVLSKCPVFEILSRPALEIAWKEIGESYPAYTAIFFDVRDMKDLNRRLCYAGVNALIHRALGCVRKTETIARWYSGDEFVCLVHNSAAAIVHSRLVKSFAAQGVEVDSACGQCLSRDLVANIEPLTVQVMSIKASRKGV